MSEDLSEDLSEDCFSKLKQRAKEAKEKLEAKKLENVEDSETETINKSSSTSAKVVTVDIFDIKSYRTDIDSLNYPIFALAKNINRDTVTYEHQNIKMIITPNSFGQATIFDKDVWIYCISKLSQAIYQKKEVSPTIRFKMTEFLRLVSRKIDGTSPKRAKAAFDRLTGTRVKIEIKEGKKLVTHSFGLLEEWKTIEGENGVMEYIQVTLPQWIYNSVLKGQLKKIPITYFELSKSLERRVYEVASKYCYNNPSWFFSLELLHSRCGSKDTMRGFRRNIKNIAKEDKLPNYHIVFHADRDMVEFINRDQKVHEKAAKKADKPQQDND